MGRQREKGGNMKIKAITHAKYGSFGILSDGDYLNLASLSTSFPEEFLRRFLGEGETEFFSLSLSRESRRRDPDSSFRDRFSDRRRDLSLLRSFDLDLDLRSLLRASSTDPFSARARPRASPRFRPFSLSSASSSAGQARSRPQLRFPPSSSSSSEERD